MRLPIAALIMICIAGICFFMFVTFNYAFHGEGGLKEIIWESGNKTMSGDQQEQFNDVMPQLSQGFGITGVLCVALAVVFFVVEAFHDPRGGGRY